MKIKKKSGKGSDDLRKWQEIVASDEEAYSAELARMDQREAIFQGRSALDEIIPGDSTTETPHVRNIVSELIESQINSTIPPPKVTALRKADEPLARLIEDMLRNRMNRLPMEAVNDLMERTVPVQGGSFAYLEWDSRKRTHTTIGESLISYRHPKQIIPQQGITSDIEDMDHATLRIPQTRQYLERRYGVTIKDAAEDKPEIRSATGTSESVPDMLTQYVVYFRNKRGGIGKFSYVADTELESFEDYQARRLRRCVQCGEAEPLYEVDSIPPTTDGTYPIPESDGEEKKKLWTPGQNKPCPFCGGRFEDTQEDSYTLHVPLTLPDGRELATGTVVPFYKPDIYPLLLQRNVSTFGKLLGESDVDKIRTQQNTINRLWKKMLDQLLSAGSFLLLPNNARIQTGTSEYKEIRYDSPADVAGIKPVDLTVDISASLAAMDRAYVEAQQIIGVTDSFMGRKDPTATSGKAKQFSAAQAAGRMESKRVMKSSLYQRIYEGLFKFELAYADEKRPIIGTDERGYHRDEEWDKWRFLAMDESGTPYWNTEFLFDTDSAAPLAQNREAMWQETRSFFEAGAYGDPTQIETMMFFWEQMALAHYPGAEKVRDRLREEKERQDKMKLKVAQAQKEALEKAQKEAAATVQEDMAGGQTGAPAQAVPGMETLLAGAGGGEPV